MLRDPLRARTVYPIAEGLACLNSDWAEHLSHELGTVAKSQQRPIGIGANWAFGGVVIVLVVTPWLYNVFHSSIRVLNLSDETLDIFVDGRHLARVPSTSQENPLAGTLVRVPVGTRHLLARRQDGKIVDDVTTPVESGRSHLYAPDRPAPICFWFERVGFGRSRPIGARLEGLEPQTSFWPLRHTVDIWFAPANSPNSRHFTGGVVTALRHGSCSSLTAGVGE
jgi:hypothetical protein